MTSCRKCLNGALAATEIGPRQQPINLRAGSITSSVMMPRTPRVRGVGKTEQHKTEQHRIARQVRIFDRVCTSSVIIDEAMRSPTGWSWARKTSS
jgi:hypothetical protein